MTIDFHIFCFFSFLSYWLSFEGDHLVNNSDFCSLLTWRTQHDTQMEDWW